ncbi:hypothetical protein IFM89_035906 [Coptis chinensis]|uniref:protein-serine/threonine phosphatase n=1 Tax=Coptis chinensis TaxID=261450 RepID=A0A835LCN1_9MAGN|nr:hypothetical protein IFM89_035906 [Coptis chinensis]
MFKSVVYHGKNLLGEVDIHPIISLKHQKVNFKEIRISHFSKPSERCTPLSVLHTISNEGVSFKMESKGDLMLGSLHSTLLTENKTAIMLLGEEELHLVAMSSRNNSEQNFYFWCFIVGNGRYASCLVMLNLRCLGIVFDLDETLIVANTMRSFEDRIDALQRKISTEIDRHRIDGMLTEIKRYNDDKAILKQYVENDQFVDDGLIFKIQHEVVPALSDNYPAIIRPLIRLPEKNIILTRINPTVRDTSVLVKLRPAWEDLRNYLTARGRKRFEVYVCTMAEKDYALEMWRLLDPGLNLINSTELLDRIVCVRAGSRKSLFNVFHDGICHPKMALVIDDRLKVWDEKDQLRVHVVPPFAPYYAPQAEVNNTIPVLCVARNVACNVRGSFFKEFDECILQRLSDVSYEDDAPEIPSPDVNNYLMSEVNNAGEPEDDTFGSNKDPVRFEGISDVEVKRRLKEAIPAPLLVNDLNLRLAPLQLAMATSANIISQPLSQGSLVPFHDKQLPQVIKVVGNFPSQNSLQGSPGREEGELPESELDPDTRRRLLILQHGQDRRDDLTRDPPLPVVSPVQASQPPVQSHGTRPPLEEEMGTRQLSQEVPKKFPREIPLGSETMHSDKHRHSRATSFHGVEGSVSLNRARFEKRKFSKEARQRDDRLRLKQSLSNYHPIRGEGFPWGPLVKRRKDSHTEHGEDSLLYAETPVRVLQDIAQKCATKVEFKPALVYSTTLQFSVEVWFAGEKIGEGNGRTKNEAQHQAGECSIRALANKYLSPDSQKSESDAVGHSPSFGPHSIAQEDPVPLSISSEPCRFVDPRLGGSKKSEDSVSALKQLCFKEGLALMIKGQPTLSSNTTEKEEEQAQVEIEGKVLGKGTGSTWEGAKKQAAEEALDNLKSMFGTQRRPSSPKMLQTLPTKLLSPESSKVFQWVPSSARY